MYEDKMRGNTLEELITKIKEYKKKRNAVILAHFYELPEIQDIADIVGDSLELSQRACDVKADVIVTCGVRFMAETAKILNPQKTVLLPVMEAGCPMADMVTPDDIRSLRREHPDAAVVTYVNSSAEVKAECDICCTSSNAVKVVESLSEKEIIFVPDQNLGNYVSRFISNKKFIFHNGYCPVHHCVTVEDVLRARAAHPEVPVLVHPECPPSVVDHADFAGSTAGIIQYAKNSASTDFIIGTEEGILHSLKKQNPDKHFHMLRDRFICANMKKITLESVLHSLERMEHRIELSDEIIQKASTSLARMLAVK